MSLRRYQPNMSNSQQQSHFPYSARTKFAGSFLRHGACMMQSPRQKMAMELALVARLKAPDMAEKEAF